MKYKELLIDHLIDIIARHYVAGYKQGYFDSYGEDSTPFKSEIDESLKRYMKKLKLNPEYDTRYPETIKRKK